MSEEFATAAATYCAWVESVTDELSVEALLVAARDQLLALYTAALRLPRDPETGESIDMPPRRQPAWPGFGKYDAYWEVYDPAEQDLVGGSLTDDVLDVYIDVGQALEMWRRGRRVEAIWHWRFWLDAHWGNHAADALRALHWAIIAERGQS